MPLRPAPTKFGAGVRLTATVLIAVHVLLSAWLVVQFEGRYTEGAPSPSNIKAIVAVDDEQTLIDVKIENSTSFAIYMLVRDYEPPADNSTASNSTSPDVEEKDDAESKEDTNRLEAARLFTKACLALLVLGEVAVVFGMRFRATFRGVIWATALACFLLILPGAYLTDLSGGGVGGDDDDNDDQNGDLANETFVAQTEDGAMVHGGSSIDISLAPLGVHFDMMFNGYDLGLVDKANQSDVRDKEPEPGSEDANSWVQFESRLTAKAGKNIQSLFILPVLWFFFPALVGEKEELSDDAFEEEG